jgi:hypothetical protein
MPPKKKLREELADLSTQEEKAKGRARAVCDAGKKSKQFRSSRGNVHIGSVVLTENGMGVDVYLEGQTESGETHYRIINPPTLVQDPAGDIEVRGVMYREDPLAAIAEAISTHGGSRLDRGKRRRT